jgi:AAA domain
VTAVELLAWRALGGWDAAGAAVALAQAEVEAFECGDQRLAGELAGVRDLVGRGDLIGARALLERIVGVPPAESERRPDGFLEASQEALSRERSKWPNHAGPSRGSDSVPGRTEPGAGTESSRLPFRPLGEALRNAPDEPPWLVHGMVARTLLTVLGGKPKVGKSTLAFGMLKALAHGEPFLGAPTMPARSLLLTEERHLTLNEKRKAFALDDDDVHVLMRHEADRDWPAIIEQAIRYCLENELAILVIDTWDKWPDYYADSENNSGDVLTNLAPLHLAAGSDLAVLILAHQRKGKGKHGEALRGSNAFAGAVDVILELERATGEFGEQGGRVLYGTSRLMGTPDLQALTWDENTGVFVSGSYDAVQLTADRAKVVAALDDEERTKPELADRAGGMRAERLLAILNALVDDRVAYRTGRGVRGHPLRWRLRIDEDVDPSEHEQLDIENGEPPP